MSMGKSAASFSFIGQQVGRFRQTDSTPRLYFIKATPHNCDDTISPPEISSDETKYFCVVASTQRNFLKHDGVYAGISAVKAKAVNCAAFP